ncbi:Mating-type protein ALPHA2 [Fusarium oxysporum f. sp. albedinis]|nr:Mating-type protein ALPHA2 [Fusarium oxysporum f. sp. albedinis]
MMEDWEAEINDSIGFSQDGYVIDRVMKYAIVSCTGFPRSNGPSIRPRAPTKLTGKRIAAATIEATTAIVVEAVDIDCIGDNCLVNIESLDKVRIDRDIAQRPLDIPSCRSAEHVRHFCAADSQTLHILRVRKLGEVNNCNRDTIQLSGFAVMTML